MWTTEYVIDYDGRPVNTVNIMLFNGDKGARETLYSAAPFDPPEWRSNWVEVTPRE